MEGLIFGILRYVVELQSYSGFYRFFVFQTTLSFVVLDKDTNAIKMIKDDRDDFMGSCNLSLTQVKGKL